MDVVQPSWLPQGGAPEACTIAHGCRTKINHTRRRMGVIKYGAGSKALRLAVARDLVPGVVLRAFRGRCW